MSDRLRGLTLVSMLTLMGCLVGQAQPTATPSPSPGAVVDVKQQIGVVEMSKLLAKHPDYEKLKELEQRVQQLKTDKAELVDKAKDDAMKQGRVTFLQALNRAKAEMEGEQAAISGEMEGLARALQAQMSAEMGEIKAKLDRDLHADIEKIRPAETVKLNDTGTQAVGEYAENLRLMAARSLTAHKLEKEKSVKNEIDAERNRLDQQLASSEDEVAMRYQEEKLNLQLKMQNNPSEEVEKVTRERLNTIDDEVANAKAEKRKEIDAAMVAFHDKKQSEFDHEMSSYEARLKEEMIQKVGGKRIQLQSSPGTQVAPPPELQAKIQRAQQTMQSAMESRKAELMGRMHQKEAEARARLQAKQEQIRNRLEALQKELQVAIAKRTDFLDKASKVKLAQLDKDLEKAKADYKVVYEKMRADLALAVGKVADKKKIPCVIGTCLVNLDLEDLTDLSMVEVTQMGHR